ncbi:hypothetical protein EPN16_02335, partial [bacterium]
MAKTDYGEDSGGVGEVRVMVNKTNGGIEMKRFNKLIWLCFCISLVNIFCLKNVLAVAFEKKVNKSEERELAEAITIDYNGVKVDLIVYRPQSDEVDVVLAFHGTTMDDSKIFEAAEKMLKSTKKIIKKDNIMIISVAYPEEGLLMGDNIKECEAALLWAKYNASKEL